MNKAAAVVWNELLPDSAVFSTAEVARRADITLSNASRDLAGLSKHGMVARIRRGLWAVTSHPEFSRYAVVPHLFAEPAAAYVSLLSALNLHGMIDQIPQVVHVVTRQQRPDLHTPFGSYEFYRIQENLFGGFLPYRRTGNFDMATAEKAVFDTLYISARKGRRFAFLPEVELPAEFSVAEVEGWIGLIEHSPLRVGVRERWKRLSDRVGPRSVL